MKRHCLLMGVWACAAMLLPVQAPAQTNAREILDRVIQTLGGDAYLGVSDIKAQGRFFQFQRGELVGGDLFTDYIKFPDKERTEFGKDGKISRINNGTRGWNIDENEDKVEEQISEQIDLFWEEYKVGLDYMLRYVVNEPQTTLQFVGRDMIDFKRVDILEIRDADRTRINLYVDRATGMLLKKTVRRLSSPSVHEEVYSNYHKIQNILTPLLIHRYTNGVKTMEIRFETVQYDTGAPESLFTAEVKR